MAEATQRSLLTKATEKCAFVAQRLAIRPRQQETPSREPRPHLTVPVYKGYDVKSMADFMGELLVYHLVSGASEAFIVDRIVPLALRASARCLGSQGTLHQPGRLPVKATIRVSACGLCNTTFIDTSPVPYLLGAPVGRRRPGAVPATAALRSKVAPSGRSPLPCSQCSARLLQPGISADFASNALLF